MGRLGDCPCHKQPEKQWVQLDEARFNIVPQSTGTGSFWHTMGQTTEFLELHSVQTHTSKLKLMSGPIPPGHSFTYRFRATRYGTTWYHGHFSLQYSEGLLGPFIINGPTIENWDIDLGTVLLQDWYHTPVSRIGAISSTRRTRPPGHI